MANPSDYLPALLGPVKFQDDGVDATPRGTINLVGFTVTDDAPNDAMVITSVGGGGSVDLTSGVTGVLPFANGGTGLSALGTGLYYLRTNAGATAMEWAQLTISGVGGLGTGVATFLGTPSGANLASALTSALPVSKGGTGVTSLTLPASGLVVGTTDSQTLTNKTLTSPVVNGQTQGAAVAMGASAIDWSLGQVFTKTLSAGANTFTFSNQASGMTIIVRVTGAASTLTWPTVKWAGGAAPTQTSSGTDVYTFVHDGTNIYGSVVQNLS